MKYRGFENEVETLNNYTDENESYYEGDDMVDAYLGAAFSGPRRTVINGGGSGFATRVYTPPAPAPKPMPQIPFDYGGVPIPVGMDDRIRTPVSIGVREGMSAEELDAQRMKEDRGSGPAGTDTPAPAGPGETTAFPTARNGAAKPTAPEAKNNAMLILAALAAALVLGG